MSAPSPYPIDEALIGEVYRLGLGGGAPDLPRHRHDLSREQIATTQKARIILATAEEVTSRTYARTTTRAIIERAGVSSKTFYEHYSGKEDAFLAGYTLLDGVVFGTTRSPAPMTDPRAATRESIDQALGALAAWPLFARMRLVEGRAAGPIADQRRLEMAKNLTGAMLQAIAAAREYDPRVGNPSEGAVATLVAGLSEQMTRHVIEHGASTLPVLAPALVESIERFTYGDPPPYVPRPTEGD